MKKFVIISDTSCGLVKEEREKYGIECVNMYYCYDGNTVLATIDWEDISAKEFYDLMRSGKKITSAQVSAFAYKEKFENALAQGLDVLYLGTPAVLSNSVNVSYLVRDELQKKYPDSKIICMDTYSCMFGLGLMCIKAAELRDTGNSVEETAEWLANHSQNFHQVGTVDKLEYLKRAGRVSATSAFFGGLLNIKPIIICDLKGRNAAIEKVKGRKNSLNKMIEYFKENYIAGVCDQIYISHADCLDEALEVKKMVEEVIGEDKTEIKIGYVVSTIGASVGPGMIGLYFYGKDITYDAEKK